MPDISDKSSLELIKLQAEAAAAPDKARMELDLLRKQVSAEIGSATRKALLQNYGPAIVSALVAVILLPIATQVIVWKYQKNYERNSERIKTSQEISETSTRYTMALLDLKDARVEGKKLLLTFLAGTACPLQNMKDQSLDALVNRIRINENCTVPARITPLLESHQKDVSKARFDRDQLQPQLSAELGTVRVLFGDATAKQAESVRALVNAMNGKLIDCNFISSFYQHIQGLRLSMINEIREIYGGSELTGEVSTIVNCRDETTEFKDP